VFVQGEKQAVEYLDRLGDAFRDGPATGRRSEELFNHFLGVAEAPAPDPRLRHYFWHIGILLELAEVLHVPFSTALREAITRLGRRRRWSTPGLRVRRLGPGGRYPNFDVAQGRAWYAVRRGTPYLLTLNSRREEARWSHGSELSDWTRHETRMATAISCTEYGGFAARLTGRFHDLPTSVVAHVSKADLTSFMAEYAFLAEYIQGRRSTPLSAPRQLAGEVEFGDFRRYGASARRFASKFLVSHPLLLRTSRHYLKSSMLWNTEGLEEEALANVFFALEGCLLLFQEVHGERSDKLDRTALRRVFSHTYVGGEGLYDFIDDAMGWGGTRARVVHPQLAHSDGWMPYLAADDYFEYHRIVRLLLTYVVTGSTFWDFELTSPATAGGPSHET
jgi:hypothetical protein